MHKLSGDAKIDLHWQDSARTVELNRVSPALNMQDIPLTYKDDSAGPVPSVQVKPISAEQIPQSREIWLTFAGTVAVETAVRQSAYYSESKQYDFSDIFSLLSSSVASDYAIVPMENVILPSAQVSDLVTPEKVMGMFTAGKFDALALGFPKCFDKGREGVESTVLAAQNADIDVMGLYRNEGEAAVASRICTIGNMKVAFLHYTEALTGTGKKSIRKADMAYAVPLLEQAEQDIGVARSLGAEVVVISVNWGSQGKTEITKTQKNTAQRLAAAGADLIIGNGPRRVQPVEILEVTMENGTKHNALCAYSLGCLLSASTKTQALQSVLLHVKVVIENGEVHLQYDYTPVFLWRYRQENLIRFRTIRADGDAPDGMTDDQKKKRDAALTSLSKIMQDVPQHTK